MLATAKVSSRGGIDSLHQGAQLLKRVSSLETPTQMTNADKHMVQFTLTLEINPETPILVAKKLPYGEKEAMGEGNHVRQMSGYRKCSSNGQSLHHLFSNPR